MPLLLRATPSSFRAASESLMRRRKKSASTFSCSRHDHTRAVICASGLYAAQARKVPAPSRTGRVSPRAGAPSMRSIAPENIHGWRRSKDFSRPALRMMPACAPATPGCGALRAPWLSVVFVLRWWRLRKSRFPCEARCGAEGDVLFCRVMFYFPVFFFARGWAAS